MGYFGIPFRNGVPIGLGSIVGFGAPQEFSPSELFLGGTAGAWYDPSDLSTLFTTSAGTTQCAMPGQGSAVSVGRMLDKSGNGNHAIAFNDTTARPELRARVNLLTYSEDFSNAAWGKNNTTVSAVKVIDPLGGITAQQLYETATTGVHGVNQAVDLALGVSFVSSCYVKANGRNFAWISVTGGAARLAVAVDLTTGQLSSVVDTFGNYAGITVSATDAGNGWWRLGLTARRAAGGADPGSVDVGISDSLTPRPSYAGDVTKGIYIWGADLRPANIGANVPAYQRIADANTYDTSGFPLYLRFDGIDDSMYTPANLNLSGTDKVAVFAGVRKLAQATNQRIVEFSDQSTINNGAFQILPGDWATGTGSNYSFSSRGTITAFAQSPANYAAPVSNVLTGFGDIAGDSVVLRINGTQVATSATNQGTGNFGTYPLFIGARNNSSAWFNGHLHSLIIAGSAVSAGNISATEQWVAGKTGIAL